MWECARSSRQLPVGRVACVSVKVLTETSFGVDILEYASNCIRIHVSSQILRSQASPAVLAAWARLLRAHAAATRELNAQLQAEHGLTINDYEALLLLSHAENGSMRRIDLAGEL